MKKGYRKCTQCGQIFPKGEIVQISGKAYCLKCSKPKAKESKDNSALSAYLYDLCDKEQDLMPFLMTQVKRLKDQYGFKTTGILATLHYLFDITDNPPVFKSEYGIEGIVIKNYYQAKKYYESIRELYKQLPEDIDEALKTPVKEVHLNKQVMQESSQAFINKQKDLQYGPAIDLNSIEDEYIEEEEEKGFNE